jgi:hypothetical protein
MSIEPARCRAENCGADYRRAAGAGAALPGRQPSASRAERRNGPNPEEFGSSAAGALGWRRSPACVLFDDLVDGGIYPGQVVPSGECWTEVVGGDQRVAQIVMYRVGESVVVNELPKGPSLSQRISRCGKVRADTPHPVRQLVIENRATTIRAAMDGIWAGVFVVQCAFAGRAVDGITTAVVVIEII